MDRGAWRDRWRRLVARLSGPLRAAVLAGLPPGRTEGEKRIVEIFESISDAFFALDGEWRFTYLNPEAERLLSRSRDELLGKNVWEEFPEAVGSTFYREYRRAVSEGSKVSFEEYYPPLETWFEVNAYPSGAGLSVYFRNVNERKRMEEALLEGERRLRALLVQYSSDIIMILEADGTIRYQSPAVERVLGYRPEELLGERPLDYLHPEDAEWAAEELGRIVDDPGRHELVEYRFRHKDGSWRWIEGIFNNLLSDPDVGGIVVNSRDVTERKRLEGRLAHLAYHDPLTGLPNRALLRERFGRAASRADRDGKRLALLYLDLDGFKAVNDSLGHEAGDGLLVAVAERLEARSRFGDTVARIGGDEFCVLAEDVDDARGAERVAERVRETLRKPFSVGVGRIPVTASVGVATRAPGEDVSLDGMLRGADAAMYRAKQEKKGKIRESPEGPDRRRGPSGQAR